MRNIQPVLSNKPRGVSRLNPSIKKISTSPNAFPPSELLFSSGGRGAAGDAERRSGLRAGSLTPGQCAAEPEAAHWREQGGQCKVPINFAQGRSRGLEPTENKVKENNCGGGRMLRFACEHSQLFSRPPYWSGPCSEFSDTLDLSSLIGCSYEVVKTNSSPADGVFLKVVGRI
ncbi:hypothetical protein SKAU_G00070040 [Synaphobranchus kaupii]|uniref:Uncharacterized protein n=1 Tax=Synaphobranchus kaupii TaxID=118154 RepID=A0A9Q1J9F3_SYNKA|nr:hypothetical protein SKAU_G00070040 [Synaphobranchus kaupii]